MFCFCTAGKEEAQKASEPFLPTEHEEIYKLLEQEVEDPAIEQPAKKVVEYPEAFQTLPPVKPIVTVKTDEKPISSINIYDDAIKRLKTVKNDANKKTESNDNNVPPMAQTNLYSDAKRRLRVVQDENQNVTFKSKKSKAFEDKNKRVPLGEQTRNVIQARQLQLHANV